MQAKSIDKRLLNTDDVDKYANNLLTDTKGIKQKQDYLNKEVFSDIDAYFEKRQKYGIKYANANDPAQELKEQLDLTEKAYNSKRDVKVVTLKEMIFVYSHTLPVIAFLFNTISIFFAPLTSLFNVIITVYDDIKRNGTSGKYNKLLLNLTIVASIITVLAVVAIAGVSIPFIGPYIIAISSLINVSLFVYSFVAESAREEEATKIMSYIGIEKIELDNNSVGNKIKNFFGFKEPRLTKNCMLKNLINAERQLPGLYNKDERQIKIHLMKRQLNILLNEYHNVTSNISGSNKLGHLQNLQCLKRTLVIHMLTILNAYEDMEILSKTKLVTQSDFDDAYDKHYKMNSGIIDDISINYQIEKHPELANDEALKSILETEQKVFKYTRREGITLPFVVAFFIVVVCVHFPIIPLVTVATATIITGIILGIYVLSNLCLRAYERYEQNLSKLQSENTNKDTPEDVRMRAQIEISDNIYEHFITKSPYEITKEDADKIVFWSKNWRVKGGKSQDRIVKRAFLISYNPKIAASPLSEETIEQLDKIKSLANNDKLEVISGDLYEAAKEIKTKCSETFEDGELIEYADIVINTYTEQQKPRPENIEQDTAKVTNTQNKSATKSEQSFRIKGEEKSLINEEKIKLAQKNIKNALNRNDNKHLTKDDLVTLFACSDTETIYTVIKEIRAKAGLDNSSFPNKTPSLAEIFKLLLSDKDGNILNPEKIRTNEWLKSFRSPKFILGFERRHPEKFASCLKQRDGDKYIFHDLIESSQNLSEQGYRRILPGIKLDNTQKQQFHNILKNMNIGNSKKVEKSARNAPDEKI